MKHGRRFIFSVVSFLVFALVTAREVRAGANTWTSGGPLNMGGRMYALALVPTATPAILASGFTYGAVRSTDSGATWSPVSGIPTGPYSQLINIAACRSNPSQVFAVYNEYASADVYRSLDGGATWTAVGSAGIQNDWATAVACAPNDANRVYVGTFGGVYASTDGGGTWGAPAGPTPKVLAVDPTNRDVVYLGRNAAVLGRQISKSTDGGATWAFSGTGLVAGTTNVRALAVDPATPSTLLASANNGIYRSTNSGGTWNAVTPSLPPTWGCNTLLFPSDAPGTLLAECATGLYSSTSDGTSWTAKATAPAELLQMMAGTAGNLFVGTWAGLYRSTDSGATLSSVPSLVAGRAPSGWIVAGDPASTSSFYLGTFGGLFHTTDDGQTWAAVGVASGLGNPQVNGIAILPGAPNVHLVATGAAGLFRSTDTGATWTNVAGFNGNKITPDPLQSNVVYAGSSAGVLTSTDQGATWTAHATGIGPTNTNIWIVAPDPKHLGVLYAGAFGDGVFKSTDGGLTWAAAGAWTAGNVQTYALAVDPVNTQTVYMAPLDGGSASQPMQRSTDGGGTWAVVNIPGIPGPVGYMINVITVDPLDSLKVYASTDNGVYRTTDGGSTWAIFGAGLPANAIAQDFAQHPGDATKWVMANVNDGGGWSYSDDPTGPQVAGGGGFANAATVSNSWSGTGGASGSYSPTSADSDGTGSVFVSAPAGSLRTALTSGSGTGTGIEQGCLPVDVRNTYAMVGKVFIPSGQSASGSAHVVVSWYSDTTCTALLSATQTPDVTAPPDAWNATSLAGIHPPASAVRGRLGLSIVPVGATGTFGANFDDVSLSVTCDGPTAAVSGGGAIHTGENATLLVALTGLAPWTLTWSDGFVQTNVTTSPALRSVSPAATTTYTVTSLADGICAGGAGTGSAPVYQLDGPPACLTVSGAFGNGSIGNPYSQTVTASGGTGPYTFDLLSGTLPAGLSLSSGGLLAGTPTAPGSYGFSVVAADSGGGSCTGAQRYTVGICGSATAPISAAASVCASSTGNVASVANAGTGATYGWTISNGTITGGLGTSSVTYEAGNSGTVGLGVTVSPNAGCAALGSQNVAITADAAAPTVYVPAPITLDQNLCCGVFGGATPASSASLAAFLAGGGATDNCTFLPTRLTPRIAGLDVTTATCFEAGTTSVTFRFQDATGNIGTAAANVTVRMYGDLDLNGVADPSDMVVLRAYFNFVVSAGTPPFNAPLNSADLSHNTIVDPSDMVLLRAYFNFVLGCLAPAP